MDSNTLKEILEEHKHWLNGDCEGWEDMHADLRFTDLRGANLRGATLCSANLQGANLQYADLRDANLQGANLRDANLQGANLRHANLRHANLQGADLFDADLRHANLQGADLRHANLRGADLRHANLQGADLFDANLRGADLLETYMDYSCLPLWCGSLGADFDSRQLKQIAYHLVKAGLQSKNSTDEDRRELSKLIDYANGFHRAQECGVIKGNSEIDE